MKRHELTDEQWTLVEKHLKGRQRPTGRPGRDPRVMLNGVMWVLGTGAPWRDLPERFGPWRTVYHHFSVWRRQGVFARVVEDLQIKLDKKGLIDWDLWCVDVPVPIQADAQRLEHPLDGPVLAPPVGAVIDARPLAVALGQIAHGAPVRRIHSIPLKVVR